MFASRAAMAARALRPTLSAGLGTASFARPAATRASAAGLVSQRRTMYDWALRPYAAAAAQNPAESLSLLNAGFSKVGLSLLVAPWKALPTALVILPACWAVPAMYKMFWTNSSRNATAHVYNAFMQFTLAFLPLPIFENLFAEMTFYGVALFLTFFVYNLFPEIMLNDFIWMYYSALFALPLLPLAFTYLPIFTGRAYFFL